jgi:tetratricopeptide (TPR) repeat protein
MLGLVLAAGTSRPAAAQPAGPAHAARPPVPGTAEAASGAATGPDEEIIAQLVRNAQFWHHNGQSQFALREIERTLAVSPQDPTALALAARVAFEAGSYEAGARYRQHLREVAGQDPRLAALDAEKPHTLEDERTLADARAKAAAGRQEEATAAYRRLFAGPVPDSMALEYYLVLSTVSAQGFSEAVEQLGKVAERWPDDPRYRLAQAEVETFRASTRAAGIQQLAALSHDPAVGEAAHEAWRRALLWQGPDIPARNQLLIYLHETGRDPAVEAKLDEMQNKLRPDESGELRVQAYRARAAGNLAQAEQDFQAALKVNKDDSEAMIMLSVLRRKQGQIIQADRFVARAFVLAPDRIREYTKTIGPNVLVLDSNMALTICMLIATKDYDQAEALLTHIDSGRAAAAASAQLAALQLAQGRLDDAERSYRNAVAIDPRNANALCGIADILGRKAQFDDAWALYDKAGTVFGKAKNQAGLLRVARGHATLLRAATETTERTAAISTYLNYIKADPGNMALRIDLARLMRDRTNPAPAWEIIEEGLALNHADRPSLVAALDFANQTGDQVRAASLMTRLGQGDQDSVLVDRGQVDREVRQAQLTTLREFAALGNEGPATGLSRH